PGVRKPPDGATGDRRDRLRTAARDHRAETGRARGDIGIRPAREGSRSARAGLESEPIRHAIPFTYRASSADGRNDADCRHGLAALRAQRPVHGGDSGWHPCGLSALCRFGRLHGIRECGLHPTRVRSLGAGCGGNVLRGDFPAAQGGRLVGIGRASLRATVVTMRLAGAAFGSALAMAPIATSPSAAQATLENEQMLLEADTLTYDQDTGIVVASGDVRIAYQGRRLVAQRVEFNRNTSRMYAFGDVEMVDADGNRHYADELDVTDDLGEGFANAIRIETTDETYFAAESGERQDGSVTTFNSGVYTACKPCEEH